MVVGRSVPLSLNGMGAIVGPVGSEPWRYVTAPFVYSDVGAFLVTATAIGVFGASIERRLGSPATALLILATGTFGVLAAAAASSAGLTDFLVAAGGNGVALGLLGAWLMLWRAEAKTHFSEPLDAIGVAVVAVVLLLLPAFEITADPIAGLAGGIVGLGMGMAAARRGLPESG
jgi:membrane associated rhomboid family serine protease